MLEKIAIYAPSVMLIAIFGSIFGLAYYDVISKMTGVLTGFGITVSVTILSGFFLEREALKRHERQAEQEAELRAQFEAECADLPPTDRVIKIAQAMEAHKKLNGGRVISNV